MTLRDVNQDDLPELYEHQRDPEACRIAAFPPRDREAFMAHWTQRVLTDPRGIKKTVVVDGGVAGYIVSFDQAGRRLVGYWIGREHWGRGVATGALRQFLEVEQVRPLFAFVAVANLGSIRVLERCGFVKAPLEPEASSGVGEPVEELLMRLDR